MEEKLPTLERILTENAPLLVAYSGGVDSTCLLAFATRALGDRVSGVIADSPSLPREGLAEALRIARTFGAAVEVLATREFEDPRYTSNPPNRCYFCKAELFSRMDALASRRGIAAIAYGENADDPAHLRPGSQAAAQFAVLAPLRQAGLTKADVRELSRKLGLPTADQPAQPCLSSRIPFGTEVTPEAVGLIEKGEAAVRSFGLCVLRVRYVAGSPPGARVQVAPEEQSALELNREEVIQKLLGCGFGFVEIDPNGYRAPSSP